MGVLHLQMGYSIIIAVFRQSDVTTTHTFGGWGVCNVGVGEQCGPRGGCSCAGWGRGWTWVFCTYQWGRVIS